jgi:hypothetical protein
MKLLRIAKGRWDVLAPVDPEGRCPLLDFLTQPGEGLRPTRDLLNLFLHVYLPLEGPPEGSFHACKPLGDGLFELRRQPGAPALRLSLFGDGNRIVCTKAETQSTQNSRQRYFEAKSARGLDIMEAL